MLAFEVCWISARSIGQGVFVEDMMAFRLGSIWDERDAKSDMGSNARCLMI